MPTGRVERFVTHRPAMLAWLAVWLTGWTVLVPLVPAIARYTSYDLPVWWAIALVYVLDRRTRLRTFYVAAVASWAFFFVHNLPLMLTGAARPPEPLHWALLAGAGLAAGLANGRRCAGVAALAATFLGVLWTPAIIERASGSGALYRLHGMAVFELPLIVLGGLLADLVVRVPRRRDAGPAPSPVLWAFVAGLVLPRLTGLLIVLAMPGGRAVAPVSLPRAACGSHCSQAANSPRATISTSSSATAPRAPSSAPRSASSGVPSR